LQNVAERCRTCSSLGSLTHATALQGSNTYAPVYWDMTMRGPEDSAKYVYDTAWLYALALDSLINRGDSPYDGVALKQELLRTEFDGVTGHVVFDLETQDRRQNYDLVNVKWLPSGELAYVRVGAMPDDRSTHLQLNSPITFLGGGTQAPSDGLSKSTRVDVVRLGVLLPSFTTAAFGNMFVEWSPLVGVYQALAEIVRAKPPSLKTPRLHIAAACSSPAIRCVRA
jgi:hypothetical protein